jgi:hypothetical protein
MRVFTFEGVEHKLSERNWKKMLRRFDSRKASLNSLGYYLIPVKSICYVRNYKCTRCSLRDPHKKINSCTYLFNKMIGEDLMPYIFMRDSGVLWDQKDDAKARQGLQRVFDILSAASFVPGRKTGKKS